MTRWLKAAHLAQLTTDETDKTDETPSSQGFQVGNPQETEVLSVVSVLSVGRTDALGTASANLPLKDRASRFLTGNNGRLPSRAAANPIAGYRSG